ncbi:MAG: hypothetical protein CL765_06435 [Chloroflexi bacterium]|nr:hypothetical protein [Chloroflexota bacterium]|tara:strand:+ start:3660 stop:4199 length:540 start_codon:yes stop_codon:yes gene_type:complete
MASEGTHSMIERMIRASRLDINMFEEVEADTSATNQALLIVALVALATGIASLGTTGPIGLFVGVVLAIAGWALWAWIVHLIGTKIIPSHSTHADWGQLARTLGFAQSPGIFRALGFIPVVGNIIFAVASIWMLVAMVVAVRQALDYTSTLRAIAVVLIGFIPYLVLMSIAFALLGALK